MKKSSDYRDPVLGLTRRIGAPPSPSVGLANEYVAVCARI